MSSCDTRFNEAPALGGGSPKKAPANGIVVDGFNEAPALGGGSRRSPNQEAVLPIRFNEAPALGGGSPERGKETKMSKEASMRPPR